MQNEWQILYNNNGKKRTCSVSDPSKKRTCSVSDQATELNCGIRTLQPHSIFFSSVIKKTRPVYAQWQQCHPAAARWCKQSALSLLTRPSVTREHCKITSVLRNWDTDNPHSSFKLLFFHLNTALKALAASLQGSEGVKTHCSSLRAMARS